MKELAKQVDYISRANQPDRIFLSSNDAQDNGSQNGYNFFTNTFQPAAANGVKKILLLRATIPNSFVNIPDYQLVFYYYKMGGGGGFNQPRTQAKIKAIRLMPSNFVNGYGALTNMPVNTYFADPSYLVAALNSASANDSATFNPLWGGANDVSFSWNSATKKISMTGADPSYIYEPVPYNSPNLNGIATIAVPTYSYGNSGLTTTVAQPTLPQTTLNLRCGYAIANDWTTGGQPYTEIGGVGFAFDSFPNLIYTQCYFLYSSIVAGSGYGSAGQRDLLAVIPTSGPSLAVTNYTALTVTWLKKVSEEIYAIRTEIRDDNNQPIIFPDNAVINLELALKYDEE